MAATTIGSTERCFLYRQSDGSIRIQLGNRTWIGLREDLGWLVLVDHPEAAVPLVLAGDPHGATWQLRTEQGAMATVSYTTDPPDPLLTINGIGRTVFVPTVVTPSLDAIAAAHGCPGADLTGVDLGGAQLTGLDLTKADFRGATLTGATFNEADLSGADFRGTSLDGLAWGRPKRAPNLLLTGSSARGARLGGDDVLDCSGASLASSDFTGADLSHWILSGADLSGATLRHTVLEHANLDGAQLRNAIAPRAVLRHASLRGCDAQGAVLAHADLSFADLTRVRMGSRAYLFSVAATFAAKLANTRYVPADLVAEFQRNGVGLSDQDPVTTDLPGKRWTIDHQVDQHGGELDRYRLSMAPDDRQIDVFAATADLAPACLAGATCQGTVGSRASLAGADLRRVAWQGSGATLDHADLTGASLVGAMLAQTDLTQSYLEGVDLSEAVLVGAIVRGCLVHAGADGRAPALDGALLHGTDFSGSSLVAADLVDAAVAVPDGVPLFTLPVVDEQHLTPAGLALLAPAFAAAGHPLGSAPAIVASGSWLLDNSGCTDPTAPAGYRVTRPDAQLRVYDAAHDQSPLFSLSSTAGAWLKEASAPQQLVLAFAQNGFTLAAKAPIAASTWWQITPSADAPFAGPVAYRRLRVCAEVEFLRVYGSVLVRVRDWLAVAPDGLAFHQTIALDQALDRRSVGPSGLPRSSVDGLRVSWLDFWTGS